MYNWLNDTNSQLMQDLFIAATDTMTNALEWEMAELVHSPEKMARAQSEV